MPRITKLPDGTYETRISVIDPRTGKRHQPRVRARSKRELEKAIAEARVTIQRGEYIEPDRTSLGDWLDVWLVGYQPRAGSTWQARADAIEIIKQDRIATLRLSSVQPVDVQAFVNRMSAEMSPATVRGRFAPLQMALTNALELRVIRDSPLLGVRLPAVTSSSRETWGAEQVRRFIAGTTTHPLGSALVISVMLGVRIGELTALRWPDVDLERATLSISRTLARRRGGGMEVAETPKSAHGRRKLLLPHQCVDALQRRQREQSADRMALGTLWSDDDAVYGKHDGSYRYSNSALQRAFYAVSEHCDLPRIRPHDMRHTAATNMIWAGVPIPTVSRILGHSSPAITMRVYAHVIAQMEAEAVQTIEAFYGVADT